MYVGKLKVRLLHREARTLKDKRQVVQSVKDRLRNHFNVSVAEVEAQEDRQVIVLGFALVSEASQQARTTLEQIVSALRCHPVTEFLGHELEVERPDWD